ncbi:hypothetical protein BJ138DRAFT_703150 [Hygrophoropsis aurantiaca]|uniref:Uncharacterized protein n=1 Tax=Hygrophoropsis aurantiaca TaxID=72124 RepID=A0ACB8AID7_9AGAM|nr:hypothetical protein BJ138DRAFT_703150 [Hygrophoropsis aurantiaca]
MRSKAKVYLHGYHLKKTKTSLQSRLLSHQTSTPPRAEVIDLTLDLDDDDDDDDDDGRSPSRSTLYQSDAAQMFFSARSLDVAARSPVPGSSRTDTLVRTSTFAPIIHPALISQAQPQRLAEGPSCSNDTVNVVSRPSPSSPSPSPPAIPRRFCRLPSRAMSISRPTFDVFRRSGLTLPTNSDSNDLGCGSFENPIVIDIE